MTNTKRARLSLPDALAAAGWRPDQSAGLPWIVQDKSANRNFEYRIIRRSGHDGTLLFTMQLFREALEPLINQFSYCKSKGLWPDGYGPRYTIGDIKHVQYFKRIELACGGAYPGVEESVIIPVLVEYVPAEHQSTEERK